MKNRSEQIKHLAELIEDVDIAMFTTVTRDGQLVSRPLGTQEVEFDGDLWFATEYDSGKVAELEANPQVNVAYASSNKNTYVSVSGRASVVRDRAKIEEVWSPGMKIFFPNGKDDPNLCLIRVEAQSAEYWDGPGTTAGKMLYLVTAAVTGDAEAMSDNDRVDLQR